MNNKTFKFLITFTGVCGLLAFIFKMLAIANR